MKSLLSILVVFWGLGAMSAGDCSKDIAMKEVKKICESIKKKGEKAKEENLLFKNCGDNYIWIQDTDKDIKMIMHPIKKRLNGKSLTSNADEKGFKLFVEFDIEAHKVAKKEMTKGGRKIDLKAKSSGGWVDYMWAKPGAEKATPKTSYVELCEGPGGIAWVAGSGVWKEDLK